MTPPPATSEVTDLEGTTTAVIRGVASRATNPGEVDVTEPSPEMDPAELRTELVWPIVG